MAPIAAKPSGRLPPLVTKETEMKGKLYLLHFAAKTPVLEVKKELEELIQSKPTNTPVKQEDIEIERSKSNKTAPVTVLKKEPEVQVTKLVKSSTPRPPEEGLKLNSAPYVPKESFQRNKKWIKMEDTFTLSNFMNKNHSDLVDNAIEQVTAGNKTGQYPFPSSSALNHQRSLENQWDTYPNNLREFNQREENKCFDYSGAGL